jgi:hypothetical protein
MAVDLFFEPPTIQLPQVAPLRAFRWGHLPPSIAHAVALEEQYLSFHLEMLDRIHFTEAGKLVDKPWVKPLGLSVRAGAIKAAVLVAASIAEAVLRAIAEARAYPLPQQARHRTMGKVLGAWQDGAGQPNQEVSAIWPVLQSLHGIRNNIHLFKAVEDPTFSFEAVLAQEANLVPQIGPTINVLAALRP